MASPEKLPKKIRDLELLVTEKCNSNCVYCFHKQAPKDMTDETVQNVFNAVKDLCDEDVMFTFFGGEPMLRPEFVMKWAEYFRKEMPKCKIAISTNGRIFDRSFAMWWKNLPRSTFQISYDGVCQEKNRGRAEDVRNNIKGYLELLGSKVKVRMTYLRQDVGTLYDSVVDCYNLGFKCIFAQAAMIPEDAGAWTEEEFKVYKEQVDKIYEFLAAHPDVNMSPYDSDIIIKRDTCRLCGMGRTIIAIDAEGNSFPCHRMTSCDKFNLGNLNREPLNRGNFVNLKLRATCETCAYRAFCAPCAAANYMVNGSFSDPVRYICKMGAIDYTKAQIMHNTTYAKVYEQEQMLRAMIQVLHDVRKGNGQIIRNLRCMIS